MAKARKQPEAVLLMRNFSRTQDARFASRILFFTGVVSGAVAGLGAELLYIPSNPDGWYLFFGPVVPFVLSIGTLTLVGALAGLATSLILRLLSRAPWIVRSTGALVVSAALTYLLLVVISGEKSSWSTTACLFCIVVPQIFVVFVGRCKPA
jgi:hypothetical protein